jgi:hypothetical protein
MPRIGAGYGGLSWGKLQAIVERVFAEWSGTIYVYEEYIPQHADKQSVEFGVAKND